MEVMVKQQGGDASPRAEHSVRLYDLLLANDFAGLETLKLYRLFGEIAL